MKRVILKFFYRQYLVIRLLPGEIKRSWQLWFPPKNKPVTYAEIYKRYKQFSKNQLFQMLCDLIAEEQRIFPHADRKTKHDAKQYNSKKVLIKAIFMALNRKANGDKNEISK